MLETLIVNQRDFGPFSLQEANSRFVRGKYKSDKELRSITPRIPLSPPDILEIFYELWKIFVQFSRDIERVE